MVPQRFADGLTAPLVLARNPRPKPKPTPLPPDLVAKIVHEDPVMRQGAVLELLRIADGNDKGQALTARAYLIERPNIERDKFVLVVLDEVLGRLSKTESSDPKLEAPSVLETVIERERVLAAQLEDANLEIRELYEKLKTIESRNTDKNKSFITNEKARSDLNESTLDLEKSQREEVIRDLFIKHEREENIGTKIDYKYAIISRDHFDDGIKFPASLKIFLFIIMCVLLIIGAFR